MATSAQQSGSAPAEQGRAPTFGDVFAFLSAAEAHALDDEADEARFAAAEILVAEGSPPLGIYLIKEGVVRVTKDVGGHSVLVEDLQGGEILGEMSFVLHKPTSATASAQTPVVAARLSLMGLTRLMAAMPGLGEGLYRSIAAVIARRLNVTTARLAAVVAPATVATPDPARIAAARAAAKDIEDEALRRVGLI